VAFDVAHQILNELGRFLLAEPSVFGIAVIRVAEIGPVEGQVDVFRKATDGAIDPGQGGAALEDKAGELLALQRKEPLQGPANQKSFSMILSATPRAAPVSPNSAARSFDERATLSINVGRLCASDRDERWPHPRRRLYGGGRERLLVTRRELARSDLRDIGRTHGPNMAKGLNDGARRAAWGDQMLRRRMPKVDHALARCSTRSLSMTGFATRCAAIASETAFDACLPDSASSRWRRAMTDRDSRAA
jgi:hypothetical protein